MNVAFIVGRLTASPTLSYNAEEKALAVFSVACDRPVAGKKADFIRCVAYGEQGELCAQYLKRGSWVAIAGHLQRRMYCKDGKWNSVVEVVASTIEFLSIQPKPDEPPQEDQETDEESPLETPPAN